VELTQETLHLQLILTLAINVQINTKHNNQTRPQILECERLGEEHEGDDDGDSFATRGDSYSCESPTRLHKSQNNLYPQVS